MAKLALLKSLARAIRLAFSRHKLERITKDLKWLVDWLIEEESHGESSMIGDLGGVAEKSLRALPEPCVLCGESIMADSYYGIFVRSSGGIPGRMMILCGDCNCRMRERLGENVVVEKGEAYGEGDAVDGEVTDGGGMADVAGHKEDKTGKASL